MTCDKLDPTWVTVVTDCPLGKFIVETQDGAWSKPIPASRLKEARTVKMRPPTKAEVDITAFYDMFDKQEHRRIVDER